MRKPRRWSLILTGPNSGPISHYGDQWERSPAHYERVQVQEILPDGEAAAAAPGQGGELEALAASIGVERAGAAWVVPGDATAHQSAGDAIRALVDGLRAAKPGPQQGSLF